MKKNVNAIKAVNVFEYKVFDLETLPEGYIIPGYDHRVLQGNKNTTVYVNGHNYNFYYEKNINGLILACETLDKLINHKETLSAKGVSDCFETLCSLLWIVNHDSEESKLEGLHSVSTCCLDNMYCMERMENRESVCSHCYAATQQKRQAAIGEHNIINGVILKNIVIPAKYYKKAFPAIGLNRFFRFESFGDTSNKLQALNYVNIAAAFPKTSFAIWSKNHGIFHFAFMETEKPKNMIYIASSMKVNKPDAYLLKTYSFIDHIFTVYTKEFAQENRIEINCGGRKCFTCLLAGKNCYYKKANNIFINEILK